MSSFSDVRQAACRVVAPDGGFRGTGFFVLSGGYLLTCHHVVFGLEDLHVQLPGGDTLHPAEYLPECSNPEADIAVLRVPELEVTPVQVGSARADCDAVGYGFRGLSPTSGPGTVFLANLVPARTCGSSHRPR